MGARIKAFMEAHPNLKAFVEKVGKDNIGMLAAFVSWSILTSIVPIIVGLVAISGFLLGVVSHNPSTQQSVIDHLHSALQGALTRQDIQGLVKTSTQHTGLFGIIGFLGVLWGGANVGGSISTAFQAIFEVKGRSFIQEKLIDIGMIFVFTILMLVIVVATTAGTLLGSLFTSVPIPGGAQFAIGTIISLLAAFVLFAAIFLVLPNIDPPFKYGNVWKGALVSAVLFQILSFIWPLYTAFAHFHKYGAILASLLVLTAWLYFFSMILMIGAEFVAFGAIQEAKRKDESVGPQPQDSVPQHEVLREERSVPQQEHQASNQPSHVG